MELKVEGYTIHNLTQDELDLIYAALCCFTRRKPNPRYEEVLLLAEKFKPYQSTVLANGKCDSNENKLIAVD
jgi:hypothetical protein